MERRRAPVLLLAVTLLCLTGVTSDLPFDCRTLLPAGWSADMAETIPTEVIFDITGPTDTGYVKGQNLTVSLYTTNQRISAFAIQARLLNDTGGLPVGSWSGMLVDFEVDMSGRLTTACRLPGDTLMATLQQSITIVTSTWIAPTIGGLGAIRFVASVVTADNKLWLRSTSMVMLESSTGVISVTSVKSVLQTAPPDQRMLLVAGEVDGLEPKQKTYNDAPFELADLQTMIAQEQQKQNARLVYAQQLRAAATTLRVLDAPIEITPIPSYVLSQQGRNLEDYITGSSVVLCSSLTVLTMTALSAYAFVL